MGRSLISFWLTSSETPRRVTSNVVSDASTSTLSDVCETPKTALSDAFCPTCTLIPFATYVENPAIVTVTLYPSAGGSDEASKKPSEDADNTRVKPIAGFETTISAFGTTAPDASVTMPCRAPRPASDCANEIAEKQTSMKQGDIRPRIRG